MRRGGVSFSILLVVALIVAVPVLAHAQTANVQGVVDTLLGKYKSAGQAWTTTIQNAATNLFWLLALISLGWTCISMGIKQADFMEIVAELCRYIMVTGLFFWLLTNGPTFANDIVISLREVGGSASGTGQAIYPGTLINLGMQVFQQEIGQINILLPAATGIPAAIAVIILILCALIAVNMILLLCAAWVVLYAGLIFLGFGGCRWTSDMAINYYRTVLGVGASLMTMQLIIGIGVDFLKQLVASTGTNPDVGQVAIVMCATIILAVISHRLPHMVAGMVVGGGHNGAIGGVGIMTLIGGSIAGASLAARATGTPVGTVAGAAGDQAAKQLQDRIASTEAAMAAGSAGGAPISSAGGSANAGGVSTASSGAGGGSRGGSGFSSLVQQSGRGTGGKQAGFNAQGAGAQSGSPGPAPGTSSNRVAEAEPPQDRPMSPDEQRGFGPDGNGNPSGGDQVT